MKRFSMKMMFVMMLLYLTGCASSKSIESPSDHECQKSKIAQIQRLSGFLQLKNHGTYDFLDTMVERPNRFDTLVYKTKFGEVRDVHRISAINLEYGKMLIHLLDSCEYSIRVSDIINHYHSPSTIGKNRKGDTLSLFYYVNTKSYPDCFNPDDKHGEYRKCNLFSFDFDEGGNLEDLNGMFFYEYLLK